jgi:hypothetical protein
MRLCALLDAILVRGARSRVGNQNGRALGSLRRRFLGLLRFPVRFSLALGHHCLPARASSSAVLVRSRSEARKLAKLDRASPVATAPIPRPSPEMSPRRCASNAAASLTAIATGLPWRRLPRRSRRSARSSNVASFDIINESAPCSNATVTRLGRDSSCWMFSIVSSDLARPATRPVRRLSSVTIAGGAAAAVASETTQTAPSAAARSWELACTGAGAAGR